MRNVVIQLRVDDTPQGTFLRNPCAMLRVEEGDVEDFLCVVAPMITDLLMLEVRVLHITMLLELLNIDLRLSHSCPPAIICQSNAVAKALD